MPDYLYRTATVDDIPALVKIRAVDSSAEAYWIERITGYNNGSANPQKAERLRTIIVATHDDEIVGFTAGHLTKRFDCDGELQWIDVIETYRRKGLGTGLVNQLFRWFIQQNAWKICVDPGNDEARQFYRTNGATDLNAHWMYWEDVRRR